MPQTVLDRVPVLGHVTSQGLGTDGKVYARPLKYREQEEEKGKKNETVNTRSTQSNYSPCFNDRVLCFCFFSVFFKL